MIYDCIITGAGAAGLFCAASMSHDMNGLILEKTSRCGTKLLMSGSGQCNITHGGSIKDFIGCYGSGGRKIRKCLYRFSNISLREFLAERGVSTVTRDDGKVFPASMSAAEIRDTLLDGASENGFSVRYDSPVTGISCDDGIWTLETPSGSFRTVKAVIASGGCSYPGTGSDGSMFTVLTDDLGITHTRLRPALAPLSVDGYPYSSLSGLSFENALVSVCSGGKRSAESTGGLLFTHSDLSGPAVINISEHASSGDTLKINYLYPLRYEDVLGQLKTASNDSNSDLSNIIARVFSVPKRFSRLMCERYGNSLKKLSLALTEETFTIKGSGDFSRAMATSGGIDLSQIDTSSMECRRYPGLFMIGEMLDITGISGGYNLQFAYSSARAAASEISG